MLSSSCAASPEGESSSPSSALIAASASWPAERWPSSSCCAAAAQRFALDQADEVRAGRRESRSSRRRHPQGWPRGSGRWPGPAPVRPGRPPGPRRSTARAPPGRARPWSRRSSPASRGKRRRRPRPRSGWWRRSPSRQTASPLRPGWRRGFGPGCVRVSVAVGRSASRVACLLFSKLSDRNPDSVKGTVTQNGLQAGRLERGPIRCAQGEQQVRHRPYALRRARTSSGFHPLGSRYASRVAATYASAPFGATFRNSGRNSPTAPGSCARADWRSSPRAPAPAGAAARRRARRASVSSTMSWLTRVLEGAGLVQHVGHAVRHAGAEVPAGAAEHHDDARRSCTRSSGCPRPRSPRSRRSSAPRTDRPPVRRRTACRRWRRRARCCR